MKQILVIGGGSIGERHVRCFLRTHRAAVSLCETNEAVRQRVAGVYPLAATFSSLDAALSEPFDAAVICTPAHVHISIAAELARRGMHLLIEKPLSTSLEDMELEQFRAVVERAKLAVAVAYISRVHPALQQLKQAVVAQRFGRPVELVVTAGQHFPLYRPAYREIYYTRHETGGGAIQDALTHLINAAEWLVGPVTRLVADAEHCVLDGVDVEDTVHVLTRHGGVLGSFSLNQHQPANETTLTLIGERGAARYEAHHHRWLSCVEPGTPWVTEAEFAVERDDLFVRQANMFLDLLEGRGEPACSLDDGIQTLHVNLAILRSVREEVWVTP